MIGPRTIEAWIEQAAEELLASHDEGLDLAALRAQYAGRPVAFAREVFGVSLWSAQAEILELMIRSRRVYCVSANGIGKTMLAAIGLLYIEGPRIVVVIAPTHRQVGHLFDQVRQLWSFDARERLPGEFFSRSLRVDMGQRWYAVGFVGTGSGKLTGLHHGRLTVLIDEAHDVEPWGWEGALSLTTGEDSSILAIGNPGRPAGPWYQVTQDPRWEGRGVSAFEHPNLTGEGPHIPGAVTWDFVNDIIGMFGKGSGVYESRVLGRFADSAEDSLIRRSWLDKATERHADGSWSDEASREEPLLGVDIAETGDFSCVAVRRGPRIESLTTWHEPELSRTVDRIAVMAKDAGCVARWAIPLADGTERVMLHAVGALSVDAVGMGAGPASELRKRGFHVEKYKAGEAGGQVDGHEFQYRRDRDLWHLRELLRQDRIALPNDPTLIEELLAVKWRIMPGDKIATSPKDDLKKALRRSPDRMDAVTMAMARSRGGVEVAEWAV